MFRAALPRTTKRPLQSSAGGILFKTAIAATTAYTGLLFAATKNERVMDFVTDQQLPYHEPIMDFFEHGSMDDITEALNRLKKKVDFFQETSATQISELTKVVEKTSEDIRGKLAHGKESLENLTPAEQLMKPVEVNKKQTLPAVELPAHADAEVASTVKALNDLIGSFEATNTSAKSMALVKTVDECVSALAKRISALTADFDREVAAQVEQTKVDHLAAVTQKELDMTLELASQFKAERATLEKKLNERLAAEVQAATKALEQAAQNAVSMVRVEQTRRFEQLVVENVNAERDGRLANVEALNNKLADLESFAVSLEEQLAANHTKQELHRLVVQLRSALLGSDGGVPKPVAVYVDQLASAKNDLIQLAAADLKALVASDSTQSILSTAQLLSRWELLVPELRSAALLPPDAGLLGHLTSALFSKLLLPVKGAKPDGKDIESVVARVEHALVRDRLDDAVEEVAHLKGWTRKLADDWVREARKRLEVEMLLGLVEAEVRVAN